MLRHPALNAAGDTVYFIQGGAVWCVPTKGGRPHVIVGAQWVCSDLALSPDGANLAFVSAADGCSNLYIQPLRVGGSLRQLTFRDASVWEPSFSSDGKRIYFTSDAENEFSVYSVAVSGGTPRRELGKGFYTYSHGAVESQGVLYYGISMESAESPMRKGYRGENVPVIVRYIKEKGTARAITSRQSQSLWPSVDRKGNLYYASDSASWDYALWRIGSGGDSASSECLLRTKGSVREPRVSWDGGKVCFVKDYSLWIYDVATAQARECVVELPESLAENRSFAFAIEGNITDFDVSADGRKIALVSRGRLFAGSSDGAVLREIPIPRDERATEVRWMADGVTLLYLRTQGGWVNLYRQPATGGREERLTESPSMQRDLVLSPDGERALFYDGVNRLCLYDFKTSRMRVLATDEFWYYTTAPAFHPQGEDVVFTAYRNFEPELFTVNITSGKIQRMSHNGVPEMFPVFSGDGSTLLFVSNRTHPYFPGDFAKLSLYSLPLSRRLPKSEQAHYANLFQSEGHEETDTIVPFHFDSVGVSQRLRLQGGGHNVVNLLQGVGDGAQRSLLYSGSQNGEDSYENLLFSPGDAPGILTPRRIECEAPIDRAVMAEGTVYVLSGGSIAQLDDTSMKLTPVQFTQQGSVRFTDEFRQMFYENWAVISQNFYDSTHHGVSWDSVLRVYEPFLSRVQSREDLRLIQNDMLGELNASHLGFSSLGEEEESFYSMKSLSVGLVFSADDPWRVERVLAGGPLDVMELEQQGKHRVEVPLVRPGDRLERVNGFQVQEGMNRDSLFYVSQRDGREFTLEFSRSVDGGRKGSKGSRVVAISVKPELASRELAYRYREWVMRNRAYVDSVSGGRMGYLHMQDMDTESLSQFYQDIASVCMGKEGLIVDIRHNQGGNVHDAVIQTLSQRPYVRWQARGGARVEQPTYTPSAHPLVLLMDRESLSDAEMFAAAFKELRLGRIVGTGSYRWIIFTGSHQFVDGSSTRVPHWGSYSIKGEDLELVGVTPDVRVEISPADALSGRDPQLEEAVRQLSL